MLRVITILCVCLPALAHGDEVDALRAALEAEAQALGLPFSPLDKKLTEGVAKGVPLTRIRGALDGLKARLQRGRALCADWTDGDRCTVAAADALQVGLDPSTVEALLGDSGLGTVSDRLDALFAVNDLVARGVPPSTGVEMVRALRDGGPMSPAEAVRLAAERAKGHGRDARKPDRKPKKPKRPNKGR